MNICMYKRINVYCLSAIKETGEKNNRKNKNNKNIQVHTSTYKQQKWSNILLPFRTPHLLKMVLVRCVLVYLIDW